MIHLHNHTIG